MAQQTREERIQERVLFWLFLPLAFAFVLCLAASFGWLALKASGLVGPSVSEFGAYVKDQIYVNQRRLTTGELTLDEAGKRDLALRGSQGMVDEFASRNREGF